MSEPLTMEELRDLERGDAPRQAMLRAIRELIAIRERQEEERQTSAPRNSQEALASLRVDHAHLRKAADEFRLRVVEDFDVDTDYDAALRAALAEEWT